MTVFLTLITSHRAKVKIYTRTQWVRRWEWGGLVGSSSALGKLALQFTYTPRCEARGLGIQEWEQSVCISDHLERANKL